MPQHLPISARGRGSARRRARPEPGFGVIVWQPDVGLREAIRAVRAVPSVEDGLVFVTDHVAAGLRWAIIDLGDRQVVRDSDSSVSG